MSVKEVITTDYTDVLSLRLSTEPRSMVYMSPKLNVMAKDWPWYLKAATATIFPLKEANNIIPRQHLEVQTPDQERVPYETVEICGQRDYQNFISFS